MITLPPEGTSSLPLGVQYFYVTNQLTNEKQGMLMTIVNLKSQMNDLALDNHLFCHSNSIHVKL
jgi:hypothetical protein